MAIIEVTGPNQAGEFVGKLPNGETSLLLYWEDLEALKEHWQTDQVKGDLINLSRRTRPFLIAKVRADWPWSWSNPTPRLHRAATPAAFGSDPATAPQNLPVQMGRELAP